MSRVIHFEIPSDDPEGLAAFYNKVFGWETVKAPGPMEYWLTKTGEGEPGIDGGFLRRKHPEQPMANTIGVESLDEALAAVTENGGRIALPKMPIPGIGWLAYFLDPEGNIFGMMQADTSAG
jgi:predicted enzyme related to lactoylglutathione lyase